MTLAARRGPLGVLFLTVFLDLVGFGILIPIQPFYAEFFGARPATVTLLSASFSLTQFVFAPLLGRLSDRVGRRPVMLTTIAANALGYLAFGLAGSLAGLFAARVVCGLGSANLGTAQAIVADITTRETRARGMGLIGAAFGLGFILGPAIGGLFGQLGLAVPAFIAAGLSTANFISAYFILPETRWAAAEHQAPAPCRGPRFPVFSREALADALGRLNVPQLLWFYLVGTIAFSLMEQTLGLYIERAWVPAGEGAAHLRDAARLTAVFLLLVGVTVALVQGLLIGSLVRVFGERRLLQVGTLVITMGISLLPVTGASGLFPLFMAVGPVIALGSAVTQPSASSLLSQAVGRDAFGGILGLGQSCSALGRVIGPTVAGVLFERSNVLPFWIGSALSLTCVAVALTLKSASAAPAIDGD
jgi:multidrug resistance protein